jgi:hypothetical protein
VAAVALGTLLADAFSGLIALAICWEVFRRNRGLEAARLLFIGAILLCAWAAFDVAAPTLRSVSVYGPGLASMEDVLIALLACILLRITFVFPVDLGLSRRRAPLLFLPVTIPLASRLALFAFLAQGAAPETLTAWVSLDATVLNLPLVILSLLNLYRAHRRSVTTPERSRIKIIAAGIFASLAIGTTASVADVIGLYSSPTLILAALPTELALAYAIVRYQLFDIELLRRQAAIKAAAGVMALAYGGAVALALVALTDASPLDLALAAVSVGATLLVLQSQLAGAAESLVERLMPSLKWKECTLRSVLAVHASGSPVAYVPAPGSAPRDAAAAGEEQAAPFAEVLNAVQGLVRQSLGASDRDTVRSFSMGGRKLAIEHGARVYVVAEFEGFEHPALRTVLRRAVQEIETEHAALLSPGEGGLDPAIVKRVEAAVARLVIAAIPAARPAQAPAAAGVEDRRASLPLAARDRFTTAVLALTLVAMAAAYVSGQWDAAEHAKGAVDEFWYPPHFGIYFAIGAAAALALAGLVNHVRRSRKGATGASSRRALLVVVIANGVSFTGAPFDAWWHSVYGIDLSVWSPPHLHLLAGFVIAALGTAVFFLEGESGSPASGTPRPRRAPTLSPSPLLLCALAMALLFAGYLFFEYEAGLANAEVRARPEWTYPVAWTSFVALFTMLPAALFRRPGLATLVAVVYLLARLAVLAGDRAILGFGGAVPYPLPAAAIVVDLALAWRLRRGALPDSPGFVLGASMAVAAATSVTTPLLWSWLGVLPELNVLPWYTWWPAAIGAGAAGGAGGWALGRWMRRLRPVAGPAEGSAEAGKEAGAA